MALATPSSVKRAHVATGLLASGSVVALTHILRKRITERRASQEIQRDLLDLIAGRCSPTHWAAAQGHAKLLGILLRWTSPNDDGTDACSALHCASSKGHPAAVEILLRAGADVNAVDAGANSALFYAAAGGHRAVARLLLEAGADPNFSDSKRVTSLHLAALRGDPELALLLLLAKASPDMQEAGGRTPLLTACASERQWLVAEILLQHHADPSIQGYGERLSALTVVTKWGGTTAIEALLRHKANPLAVDAFGQTALHIACRQRRLSALVALCDNGAPTAAQDNDGHYPLQLLCGCCATDPDDVELVDVAMASILKADAEAAKHLDFSDASALHTLLCIAGVEKTLPIRAVKALLAADADVVLEDDSGFTAVHYAAALPTGADDMLMVLRTCSKASPADLQKLDLTKKRDLANRKYLMRRGGHHRIPAEDRRSVLGGDISLAAIARCLTEKRCHNVVVLMGAGASTAAGIPDYRSSTGVPSTTLPEFLGDPEMFWRKKATAFLGRCPTKVHRFLARLAQEGVLRRIYTQNIDGLEIAAGVPASAVVQCHGSLQRCRCANGCGQECHVTLADINAAIGRAAADASWQAPCCGCGGVLRPDVVFFGEPMPGTFACQSGLDMESCDLLLVIGTTLSVYPVAGLVNRVPALTPRLLLNREAVGPWRGSESNPENYRDVMWQGDCDAGAVELAKLLGWQL
eukprot:gb/GFBE01058446.1/.p1 GENE.gb/GFBE01058446.1/~~gb/GFBE01058446.1/.p1  ORF type:complete len:697 (+),score=103.81 gb/GFBE01058446.1/:1-2091(+)